MQPAPLPQSKVRILNRQLRNGGVGIVALIEGCYFAEQQSNRPSVADNMVDCDKQHVLVCAQLQQFGSQQRAVIQIEGRFCFRGEYAVDFRVLIRSQCKIGDFEGCAHRRNHLHRRSFYHDEVRAENFVTCDDRV